MFLLVHPAAWVPHEVILTVEVRGVGVGVKGPSKEKYHWRV